MDLNYILQRHQVSVHRAASAPSLEARLAHRGLAAGYAGAIRSFQQDVGATSMMEHAA